jgi:hypothetical protein
MTRTELYHEKPKKLHWKATFLFILSCILFAVGFHYYSESQIRIESPKIDLGRKVVVHLPNGKEVFTYENLIVEKEGKIYYKGERNTMDLTGGTLDYTDWE